MSERELTPLERELAAVIAADLRVCLGDGPVTGGDLKRAAIESAVTLARPIDFTSAIVVERDPNDATRINVLIPASLFAKLARKAGR
jgi:hypothetical protein